MDQYADLVCGIAADGVIEAQDRFQAALTAASGAPAATPELYDEIEAAAKAFSDTLSRAGATVAAAPPPDIEGGAQFRDDTVDDYYDASLALEEIAGAAADYDPRTATAVDTAVVGQEINSGLLTLDGTIGPDPDEPTELKAAVEANDDCPETAA